MKNNFHSKFDPQSLLSKLEQSPNEKISVEEILHLLSGKGYPLLLILLSLPFCQPIQIPGFSTPFGLLIAFIGLRMAFGHRLWWPQWILKQTVSRNTLKKIVDKSTWILDKIGKIAHPRLSWANNHWFSHTLAGLVIAFLGFVLALPLPIPLSNLIAAWGILCLSIGLLEEDGLFTGLGYLAALICLAFFVFIIFSINHLLSS